MTPQKVCLLIENQIKSVGQTPPNRFITKQILDAIALLTDEVEDPDSIFTKKLQIVLNDLASDLRAECLN